MTCNFKALGLALVAIFAMSAMAAAGASAQTGELSAEESPFTLTGVEREGGENFLEAFGLKTKCPSTVYTSGELENGAESATVSAEYEGCTTAGFPTTVHMNGCTYIFELGSTTGEGDTYGLDATVNCPTAATPVVTVFTDSGHTQRFCEVEVTIDEEKDYKGLHATDETNGHIRIHGEISGLPAHKVPGSHGSIFCLSKATTEEARLVIDVTVDAHDDENNTIGVGIDHS